MRGKSYPISKMLLIFWNYFEPSIKIKGNPKFLPLFLLLQLSKLGIITSQVNFIVREIERLLQWGIITLDILHFSISFYLSVGCQSIFSVIQPSIVIIEWKTNLIADRTKWLEMQSLVCFCYVVVYLFNWIIIN